MMILTRTRCGIFARIAQAFELLSVTATLRAGEADRKLLARQVEQMPGQLAQLDADLQVLRVRQALLRR